MVCLWLSTVEILFLATVNILGMVAHSSIYKPALRLRSSLPVVWKS